MRKHSITIIGIFCLTSFTVTHAESEITENEIRDKMNDARRYPNRSLPYQAWVGDIIGIGRVTNTCDTATKKWDDSFIDIEFDTFWRGESDVGSLRIPAWWGVHPPMTNTPVLFFLTKHSWFNWLRGKNRDESPGFRPNASPLLCMDYFRAHDTPDGLWFCDDLTSWLYVNEENADTFAFASNLVFAVNSDNTREFYRIMRDNCNGPLVDKRVFYDSHSSLSNADYYFTTNFIQNVIWKDAELTDRVRGHIWNDVNFTYGIDLNAEPATVILVK